MGVAITRPAHFINMASVVKAIAPPKTIAERNKDSMMTANRTPMPVKPDQAHGKGVKCPKCGHHHGPGSICSFDKALSNLLLKANGDVTKVGKPRPKTDEGKVKEAAEAKATGIPGHKGGNPYHDDLGKFTTADGAVSTTTGRGEGAKATGKGEPTAGVGEGSHAAKKEKEEISPLEFGAPVEPKREVSPFGATAAASGRGVIEPTARVSSEELRQLSPTKIRERLGVSPIEEPGVEGIMPKPETKVEVPRPPPAAPPTAPEKRPAALTEDIKRQFDWGKRSDEFKEAFEAALNRGDYDPWGAGLTADREAREARAGVPPPPAPAPPTEPTLIGVPGELPPSAPPAAPPTAPLTAPAVPSAARPAAPPRPRARGTAPGMPFGQMYGAGAAMGAGLATPGGAVGPTGAFVAQRAHQLLNPNLRPETAPAMAHRGIGARSADYRAMETGRAPQSAGAIKSIESLLEL